MRMRQEQVVLLVCVALLGFMSWSLMQGETKKRSRDRTGGLEFDHYVPPDVARALPAPEITPALRRELFAPPRDTRPLPPLDLVEPPRRPLPGLLPPSAPGPAPVAYGTRSGRRASASADADHCRTWSRGASSSRSSARSASWAMS